MIRALFLDIRDGRLTRLPFLGYSLLLNILGLLFVFGIVAAISGAETLMGGDLQEAQAALRKAFSLPLIAVLSGFFGTVVFVALNLAAKRIRDIGLPGWLSVLAIAAITISVSLLVSDNASQTLSFVSWVALVLIPGGMMNKG